MIPLALHGGSVKSAKLRERWERRDDTKTINRRWQLPSVQPLSMGQGERSTKKGWQRGIYVRRLPTGSKPGSKSLSAALPKNYNITSEDYAAILQRQVGVCAICRREPFEIDGRTGRLRQLAVDHDHETGKVRGLLCGSCNRGVGYLQDDPELLRSAISYLTQSASIAKEHHHG